MNQAQTVGREREKRTKTSKKVYRRDIMECPENYLPDRDRDTRWKYIQVVLVA